VLWAEATSSSAPPLAHLTAVQAVRCASLHPFEHPSCSTRSALCLSPPQVTHFVRVYNQAHASAAAGSSGAEAAEDKQEIELANYLLAVAAKVAEAAPAADGAAAAGAGAGAAAANGEQELTLEEQYRLSLSQYRVRIVSGVSANHRCGSEWDHLGSAGLAGCTALQAFRHLSCNHPQPPTCPRPVASRTRQGRAKTFPPHCHSAAVHSPCSHFPRTLRSFKDQARTEVMAWATENSHFVRSSFLQPTTASRTRPARR
jgi:hypothetical protein